MSTLLRLPGQGCRHYLLGRCYYQEFLNPGYERIYRCRVLVRLQAVYDAFLTQADSFNLEDAAAAAIWRKRFLELCREDTGCQDHKPDDTESFPGCSLCLGDVCVLRLPGCPGRCAEFTPASKE